MLCLQGAVCTLDQSFSQYSIAFLNSLGLGGSQKDDLLQVRGVAAEALQGPENRTWKEDQFPGSLFSSWRLVWGMERRVSTSPQSQ